MKEKSSSIPKHVIINCKQRFQLAATSLLFVPRQLSRSQKTAGQSVSHVTGPGPYGSIMTLAKTNASRDSKRWLKWTHNGKKHFNLMSYYSSTKARCKEEFISACKSFITTNYLTVNSSLVNVSRKGRRANVGYMAFKQIH